MKKNIICLIITFLCVFQGINAQNKPLQTEAIAKLVLQKGLDSLDLGHYTGSLFMQGMSELAVLKNDPALLNKTLALFEDFKTKNQKPKAKSRTANAAPKANFGVLKNSISEFQTDRFASTVSVFFTTAD